MLTTCNVIIYTYSSMLVLHQSFAVGAEVEPLGEELGGAENL